MCLIFGEKLASSKRSKETYSLSWKISRGTRERKKSCFGTDVEMEWYWEPSKIEQTRLWNMECNPQQINMTKYAFWVLLIFRSTSEQWFATLNCRCCVQRFRKKFHYLGEINILKPFIFHCSVKWCSFSQFIFQIQVIALVKSLKTIKKIIAGPGFSFPWKLVSNGSLSITGCRPLL